jgi:hypothetical protein
MQQRIVKELTAAVGLANTIVIVGRWGGRELYVPTTVQHGDALALTLGLEVARSLVRAFGGRHIQLPAERNSLIDLRNELIVANLNAGHGQERIGLEFGLTRQMVNRIAKRAKEQGTFAGVAERVRPSESAGADSSTGPDLCRNEFFASRT